jgi:hypothetical protein
MQYAAVNTTVHTTERCVFYVKRLHQTGSVVMMQYEFQVRFDCKEGTRRSIIERLQ